MSSFRRLRFVPVLASLAIASIGCASKGDDPGDGAGGGGGGSTPAYEAVPEGCDALVPTYCGFPFPSSRYLVDDATSPTGKRVKLEAASLPMQHARPMDPTPWNDADGFSAGHTILTHLPGAVADALPPWKDIAKSLSPDSTTVLLDAETGERVAHFAEIDESQLDDERRALMIQPAARLKDKTRYIVAVRRVTDASGAPVAPTPAFEALRDAKPYGDPTIESRRALYDDIFAKLKAAGVERDDLQIAWDFVTASRENNTRWLVHMRDDALAKVGADGPEYVVDAVVEAPSEHVARRIEGRMTVPLYLDTAEQEGTLVFGEDGLPKQNGTAQFPFIVIIPNKLVTDSAEASFHGGALVQNAHGLLGDYHEGQNGYLAMLADTFGYVAFATPLVGMDGDDVPFVTNSIIADMPAFKKVVGRQHQGLLNELLLMRMMAGRFASDPNVQYNGKSVIDTSRRYYRGNSQGGIFGATYMALSTDVQRGLLGDMGAPYSILLTRSQDFTPFFGLLKTSFTTAFDMQMVLGLVQMFWDRTEPNGYAAYITSDTLPGTPAHAVLQQSAIGDHQVSLLGGQFVARTVGAKTVETPVRPLWGIDATATPFQGSGYVEYDFGTPEGPVVDVPNTQGEDPHENTRRHPAAYQQADHFFQTGEIENYCANGKCDPG